MPYVEYDSSTTTYRQACLAYPSHAAVTVPGNPNPVEIIMTLTSYQGPNRSPKVTDITTIPIIMPDNNAYGGHTVGQGPNGLAKAVMEGWIDSVMETGQGPQGEPMYLPAVKINGLRVTWAEYIAASYEGRLSYWNRRDPSYFRDPYGRKFDNPRIIDFSASYVEQIPGRTQFSLTLQV